MSLPKPYYEEEGIVIFHADCRDILPHLQPVDLCLTDPPYGETALDWDRRIDDWLSSLSTNQLWCCGSFRFFLAQPFTGWRHVQEIVWEKHNGSGFQTDRFKRVHEYVVHFIRESIPWGKCYKSPVYFFNGIDKNPVKKRGATPHLGSIANDGKVRNWGDQRLMRSVFHLHSMHGISSHPTEKPLALFSPLIEYSCPLGGVILDPFCGSGTTLLAAKQLGRRAIGIELEEKYCAIAVERLKQGVLPFNPKPPVTQEQMSLLT